MSDTKKEKDNAQQSDFSVEESFARLEEIIQSLESKETGLQEALKLYTEGVGLLSECQKTLEGVEQQLRILSPNEQ
ncbi:MAG: exodeoxyribonuclease VII small subunit [Eubacterium sp.]|nr:exodeoxyribonuclease VII small subunit [Eubacterium sp.]